MPSSRKKSITAVRISRLKALGISPYKSDRNLTKGQRDYVRRLEVKFHAAIAYKDNFTSQRVPKGDIHLLRRAGIKIYKDRAILHHEGFDSAKYDARRKGVIRKAKMTLYGDRESFQKINRPENFLDDARDFFRNKKRGEYLMMRVGDRGTIHRRFKSMRALEMYLDKWEPNGKTVEDLQPFLNILRFKPDRGRKKNLHKKPPKRSH